jgi:hypothetical protein
MPVWFPPLEKLETFIPEPEWLGAANFDDGSFEAESSLDRLDDEQDFFDSAQEFDDGQPDFGNTSMAFTDEGVVLQDTDMHYFDSMRDLADATG